MGDIDQIWELTDTLLKEQVLNWVKYSGVCIDLHVLEHCKWIIFELSKHHIIHLKQLQDISGFPDQWNKLIDRLPSLVAAFLQKSFKAHSICKSIIL
jgi:hypothetical protein